MRLSVLLKELQTLNLPVDQYAITASGVLAVRGLRAAHDLDLIVTDSLWHQLAQNFPVKLLGDLQTIFLTDNIQVLGPGSYFTDSEFGSPLQQISDAD